MIYFFYIFSFCIVFFFISLKSSDLSSSAVFLVDWILSLGSSFLCAENFLYSFAKIHIGQVQHWHVIWSNLRKCVNKRDQALGGFMVIVILLSAHKPISTWRLNSQRKILDLYYRILKREVNLQGRVHYFPRRSFSCLKGSHMPGWSLKHMQLWKQQRFFCNSSALFSFKPRLPVVISKWNL